MAQFTFEGDVEMLAEPQVKLVESALQKRGFTKGKVVVEPVGQKGDNYIAYVKRFIYEAEDGTTFKMVGKVAPAAEAIRLMMNTMLLFNNEIVMYNLVLPKFNEIQNSADISEEEKIFFPTCYGVVTEAPYEFILLEDLKEAGFEMLDKMKPLNNESVRLVIKDLAKYHSLSYVLRNSEPDLYENYSNKLLDMWSVLDGQPDARQFFVETENDILKMLPDLTDKYKNIVKGSVTQIGPLSTKPFNYEKTSKYSVIQQGDCWNNNILFRFEEGKAVENMMIDYQLSKESNPATDILYLLFNCTDHAARQKYYHEWINYYHESLDKSLNQHGLKANRIYPKDQLDTDLRRYGKLLIGLGVMMAFILRESKDVVDIRELSGDRDQLVESTRAGMNAIKLDSTTVSNIRERITGIIDSAYEFGLI